MTRLLTLAEYGDKTVFVKFCERYSKAAHRILATAGLAPVLHFCSVIIAEVFMVVTDPVDGRDAYDQFEVCDLPSTAMNYVKLALEIFTTQGSFLGT